MANKSLQHSSLTDNIFYRSMLAGNAPAAFDSDDFLEEVVLTSSAASVTFSGLDSYATAGYKHLQIRAVARDNRSNTASLSYFRLNGATTGYGLGHVLYGDGASVASGQVGASSYIDTFSTFTGSTATTGSFGAAVLDILDFSDTSKYTTTRLLGGTNTQINLKSGLYMDTAAVTSIAFTSTTSFVSGSRFSLYGSKG